MVTVAKESWSFGLAGVLYLAWSQGHIIISKYKFGNTEAGIYSIVILIMMAINIFPTTLFSRYLLPKIHKYSYHNKKKLINIYNKSNLILFIVGVIVGFLIYKSSDFFINFIFDENYSSSIQLLKLSSFIIPFRFMGLNSGTLMTTGNFLLIKNKALFIVAFLNLTIAILMPKEYGLKGLIILILISEFILFTFYHIYIKYNFIKHE
jgi:O-antigen/teichoic acid export membrane protein